MVTEVAIVEFENDPSESLRQAIKLVGGIDNLNTSKRPVVIKLGVFDTRSENHTTVDVTRAIIECFDKAPRILLAESDNYKGTGLVRLQIWKDLFSSQVTPFNLSIDKETKTVTVAKTEMKLSHILFKPNVLVSTHIVRGFEVGSILKNLFGLVPDRKKAKFHKVLNQLIPDICEVTGGIDLAVLDGTYFYKDAGGLASAGKDDSKYRVKMNTLVVGRDAVAVETVGALLVGLKPEKMPILKEAVRRGLGEGNFDRITILGSSFESVKEKYASAIKTVKTKRKG